MIRTVSLQISCPGPFCFRSFLVSYTLIIDILHLSLPIPPNLTLAEFESDDDDEEKEKGEVETTTMYDPRWEKYKHLFPKTTEQKNKEIIDEV